MNVTAKIFDLFQTRGHDAYFGEGVSQLEHALQAAWLADGSKASQALVCAALLHDVGHLIQGLPEGIADQGIDRLHENVGADWLANHFGPAVTEPIRLHVPAKRYLCYADSNYLALLSPASVQSLELQGGPYSAAGAHALEANLFLEDALSLRRWDDAAKVAGLTVPALDHYHDLVESLLRRESRR